MAGKISSENTFAPDFSKKLRSRLVSRRLRSNMDNCWLPLALYDIFRHHPVFIYIISNLKYCVTPPFDLNVTFWYKPRSLFYAAGMIIFRIISYHFATVCRVTFAPLAMVL